MEVLQFAEATERICALASRDGRVVKTNGLTGVFPMEEGKHGLHVVSVETAWVDEIGTPCSSRVALALEIEDEHGYYGFWDQKRAEEILARPRTT